MNNSRQRPWYLSRAHWLTGFVLHCASGVVAVAVHYAIMYVALAAGLSPLGSSSLGFAGGAFIRFIAAYFHIFDPLDSVPIAATRFSIALAAQFFGNAALLGLLVALGLDVWPAQVLTTISMTVLNYLVYRFWVFT